MRYPEILAIRPDPQRFAYGEKDAMLYALGVGMGADPLDTDELRFVYEEGLRVVPSMCALIGAGAGPFLAGGEIDYARLLHGEQRLEFLRPLPPAAALVTRARCLGIVDKGPGRGALLNIEGLIADAETGTEYARAVTTLFCRGDGGCGAPADGALVPHAVPARAPDRVAAMPTLPVQALLYRLNGDRNPLHCDPAVAALAGFPRPILHGLCTYGIACRALLRDYCDYDPARMRAFDARFAAPVFPGETILVRTWRDGDTVSFECSVAERDVTVVTNGRCVVA